MQVRAFLRTRVISLAARSRRLARIDYASTGIRPQDLPYAPSPAHFHAANSRLAAIDRQIARRLETVEREWTHTPPQRVLIDIALVEREIDRARRAFGMFFEVFGQRGSSFAPVLAAHDAIAEDCYTAVREGAPRLLDRTALPPVTYLEHGYSPATKRRGAILVAPAGRGQSVPGDPHPMGSRQSLADRVPARMRPQPAGRHAHLAGKPQRGGEARGDGLRRRDARRHLWPLAQGDLRRPRRAAAGRPGRGMGHVTVPDAPGAAHVHLSPRRRASHRLFARADPDGDAPPHGLRPRCGPAGTGLAQAVRPSAKAIACQPACSAPQARSRHMWWTRSPTRPGATWHIARWRM